MRVLTIRQPWARAIFDELVPKRIENRSWSTKLRGRIAIHAGAAVDELGVDMLGPLTRDDERNRGHVLGTVNLVDVHGAGGEGCSTHGCYGDPFAFWPSISTPRLWHWILADPRPFATPIPARGALQLWEAGPSLAHLISIAELRDLHTGGVR